MLSGGFLGKKQARTETQKRSAPPTSSDLRQLLNSAQKNPDKSFTFAWQDPSGANFTLSVILSHGAQKDRRAWSGSAIDHNAIGDADWKLVQDHDHKHSEVFAMRSSDHDLILTLVDEAAAGNPGSTSLGSGGLGDLQYSSEQPSKAQDQGFQSSPSASPATPTTPAASVAESKAAPYLEGNVRSPSVRTIMEAYNAQQSTGRFIVDIGTVQAEVFFMNGEPVHAKSCHSIYQDRDTVGDAVIVDLLTWKEGNFKFNQDWPAASKSVTKPLRMFLAGEVVIDNSPPPPAQPAATAPPAAAPASLSYHSAPSTLAAPSVVMPNDDFSNVDALIGETYFSLVEGSGALKFGIFLMLARSEFIRFDTGKQPFCVACIGLETQNPMSPEALRKIVEECFEPVCQPLDILGYASPSRLFVLFPHSSGATAGNTLRYFINTTATAQLDSTLHGNDIRISAGLAEVPRDGTDFQQIFEYACKLRRLATAEKKVITTAG